MKRTLISKSGQRILLTTDDTFTLAIGPNRTESTPAELARMFARKTLKALRARTGNQSEQLKLDRAIAIHEGKI